MPYHACSSNVLWGPASCSSFYRSLQILKLSGFCSTHISILSSGKSLRISFYKFNYCIFYAGLSRAASYNAIQKRFCSRSYVDRTPCGNNPRSAHTDFALLWVTPNHCQFPLHFQNFSMIFQIPPTGYSRTGT